MVGVVLGVAVDGGEVDGGEVDGSVDQIGKIIVEEAVSGTIANTIVGKAVDEAVG